ncbi:MAG: hypothetical protein ACFCU2_01640 [Acidimicrobiia bacterium]
MSEVVGLFTSRASAEEAIRELHDLGYTNESIGYLDRHRDETGEVIVDPDYHVDGSTDDAAEEAGKGAAGGAVGGAATGAGAALLASAGLLVVPGIGPLLAAGTVAATLGAAAVGAAGGAVLGGAVGAVAGAMDDDDHDETTSYYRRGLDHGDAMVTVEVTDGRESEVGDVMRRAGADRVDTHGEEGWVL